MNKRSKVNIPDDLTLYGVVSGKGWYFESPDEQAQKESDPQFCLLRLFSTEQQASAYLAAVHPYNEHFGRMTVQPTTLGGFRRTAEILNESTKKALRFQAPLRVVLSSCYWGEWPTQLQELINN